ncbi:PAP2 superfamily protein [Duganella sp. CF517]|uniref:phosphatase PAP2 family protein n=1 Tax=Duganella sp. CF517 TaxID=1881038 RepID=UPI0008AE8F74|nr:phosphatase PAP2 family protein [Duganella sp. CF517]SEN92175.1 PAP2 superfamily protein [Duganella sp. CF517]
MYRPSAPGTCARGPLAAAGAADRGGVAAGGRWLSLALNAALFGACYPATNYLGQLEQQQGGLGGVAMAWEASLPFMPWMVVPYMTSGLLFALSFLLVRGRGELSALSRRVAFATLVACLLFAAFPLRFELVRPPVDAALPAWLFAQLSLVDRPYNQLPSLHVAYCVIFWPALRTVARAPCQRAALAGWLLLVAVSTVFTYQHHVLDVAGGALLGVLAIRLLPTPRAGAESRKPVGLVYAMLAALSLLAWLALGGPWWLYLCASLLLVARAYHTRSAGFLRKRHGSYPLWIWLLYVPYLAGYLLTWQLVRLRERHRPPFADHGGGLWVGRRLSNAEAARLPADCVVIDLANELSETPALRRHIYHHFPLLDLETPTLQSARHIVEAIAIHAGQGRPIYMHCAMGYRRSREIAQLYQEHSQQ